MKQCFLFFAVGMGFVRLDSAQAQISPPRGRDVVNVITTAAPFLQSNFDAAGTSMGGSGAATQPDAASVYWNGAKLAFIDSKIGGSVSYGNALNRQFAHLNILNLSVYGHINKRQTIAFSALHIGESLSSFASNRACDVVYSLCLNKNWSVGAVFRYISVNSMFLHTLWSGAPLTYLSISTKALAADMSVYYRQDVTVFGYASRFSWGTNISNIGKNLSKVPQTIAFLPTNLRSGMAIEVPINKKNTIKITTDLNKLLVPSPPIIKMDSISGKNIIFGASNEQNFWRGMLGSFADAPGNVYWNSENRQWEVQKGSRLREELHEITYSGGIEYLYQNRLAVRTGYFSEHITKGNRKIFTFGLGFKWQSWGLDVAYLLPRNSNVALANTVRCSVSCEF